MTHSEEALLRELELEACQPCPYFKSKREENSQATEKEEVNKSENLHILSSGPVYGDGAA